MRRFRFGIALSAATAAFALGAAPALADNHQWVMEGDEYPTGKGEWRVTWSAENEQVYAWTVIVK